jgi:hypothetical protein
VIFGGARAWRRCPSAPERLLAQRWTGWGADEGLIRRIGVTGHGAQIAATHPRSVDRFDFDSTLVPHNYITMQNSYYTANFMRATAPAASRAWRSRRPSRSPGADSVATSGCSSELARTSHALRHFGLFTLGG